MKLGYSLYWICLTALRLRLLHSILDWLSFKQSIKLLTISVRQRNLSDCDWRSLKMAESKSRIFAHFKITFERLKGNWRQIFLLFLSQYIPLRLKNPKWANLTIYCAKPNFLQIFLTLNRRPFWKRFDSGRVMWYVTHVYGSEKCHIKTWK